MNVAAGRQSSMFVSKCADALTSVLSQALASEWNLNGDLQQSGPAADFEVQIRFVASEPITGAFVFGLRSADAILLARRFSGDTDDTHTQFNDDHRECLEELFRTVAGHLATSLRAEMGEVKFALAQPIESQSGYEAVTLPLSNGSESVAIALRIESPIEAPRRDSATDPSPAMSDKNLEMLLDLELPATLRFGQRVMRLHEVLQLAPGAVIDLDRQVHEPVELLVDGRLIARGEVVIVDGNYGLRITELAAAARTTQHA